MTGRRALAALAAATLLSACAGDAESAPEGSGSEPTETASPDPDVPPQWSGDDAREGTVSFADGPALAEAEDIAFTNSLAQVYDWEVVEAPDQTWDDEPAAVTVELENTGNGCRVLDERAPYEGTNTDDGAASMALVEARLADAELIAGPAQDLMGLGGGLGEHYATYDVSQALGRQDGDGPWVLVTARAFVALGQQQVITVSCPLGTGIDRTHGQLVQNAHATLRGLDKLP